MASNRVSVRVEERGEDEKEREREALSLQVKHVNNDYVSNDGEQIELTTWEQRYTRLEGMVQKRKDNFAYLKKIQQGDSFWLSSVLLRRYSVASFASLLHCD